ncbi:cysteine sulfinic acid decarboxylase-like [Zonotrichia leucophrys gambelii]|uniref:cysteine sulfinic acid decarboxylase-like n=1 Tax=Zonotrichia leucophrys gambelii TaxID=257770 RepID=UPI00313FF220
MAEPSGAGDSIPLECPGLDTAAGEEFLQEVFQILLEEGVRKSTDVTQKVCEWKEPQELQDLLDLELRSDGEGRERLLQRCRDVLRFSVRTGTPRFFNQLFSGLDHHVLAGRFLTETLNTSPCTYEVAPVLVLMEEQVLAKLRELVGWSPLKGSEPLFVCATSGTTVLGAFDPLDAIADVCARHGLWLHVDAAWGGSALLSPRLRHLLAGIHRADSVTWNPHKLLMVGLQCSAFLLRDSSGLLQRCHGVGASYLFQRDKFYDVSLDTGDKSPQCGRRADGLKLWILWKAVGTRGLAQRVERAFAASRYLLEQVKRREGFQLVMEPEFINLCFWFIPPSLWGQENSPQFWDKLGMMAPAIKEKMIRRGSMMVGYQPQGSHVNFFRQIITNPAVTRQDLDFFLDEIQELGWDL